IKSGFGAGHRIDLGVVRRHLALGFGDEVLDYGALVGRAATRAGAARAARTKHDERGVEKRPNDAYQGRNQTCKKRGHKTSLRISFLSLLVMARGLAHVSPKNANTADTPAFSSNAARFRSRIRSSPPSSCGECRHRRFRALASGASATLPSTLEV